LKGASLRGCRIQKKRQALLIAKEPDRVSAAPAEILYRWIGCMGMDGHFSDFRFAIGWWLQY
jgi:hypothetical protein